MSTRRWRHGLADAAPAEGADLPEVGGAEDDPAAAAPLALRPTHVESSRLPPGGFGGLLEELVWTARPRQWLKNLLVFAAPAAAGVLGHVGPFLHSAGAVGVFCLAASATYFLNDALDAEADRRHPRKRSRPVAAGRVSVRAAVTGAVVLMALALGTGAALAGYRLTVVVAVYLALSTAYSVRLKHEPILDLACLSSGFILRAIAGGVATNVPLSDWFLIVASFGSLFIATGKRSAEYLQAGEDRGLHRPVLLKYPLEFLQSVRLLSAAVTITAYCLWAFERSAAGLHGHHPIWSELSIIPVVLAVLYLELHYERGGGAAPEDLAVRDLNLQVLAVAWVVLFALGVYG
ncbi:MAG TPA: decaprenyl-phosphate phosphoribosyltransferase [Acidimicrobiaceae bacterium]|nr:decaprenyl-phosphate phosphoribosyltransferase [Acidimicrobiaceae bacterium]